MDSEETAELEAEEAVQPAIDDEPEEGSKPDAESEQLKADLKREREAREKADKAAADYAFKLREKKRKEPEEVEEEDEEKPLTSKSLQALLAQEREATRKEMQTSEINRLASSVSTNDTEKELILELHKSRSFPAHLSLQEQIEECYVIANKRKILGENSELKRALRGKAGASNDASTTHQDAPTGNQPKLEKGMATVMAQTGFKYNATARRYEKKLDNGILVKDLKTGLTQLVKA
jgi:hypothetical protein